VSDSRNEFQDTPLWVALESILAELTTTGEITVNTAPSYVISYLCRELVAKKLITDSALKRSRRT
jgi:hypothetical protein